MKIVGITGFKRSGKDELAKPLIDAGFTRMSFAGPLKDMLDALLLSQGGSWAVRSRMIEGNLKEEPSDFLSGHTPRWAMQSLGTEWGRSCMGADFWVECAERVLENTKAEGVVFTDVRFSNEAVMLRRRGATMFRVVRDSVTPDDWKNLHPSEANIPMIKVHREVQNNSGLETFRHETAPNVLREFGLLK